MLAFSQDVYTFKISRTGLLTIIAALMLGALSYSGMDYALAQAAPSSAPKDGVDLAPLATQVIAVLATVLTVGATMIGRFLVGMIVSKTKIHDAELENMLAARISDALTRAVDYAEAWAKSQVADPNNAQVLQVHINGFFMEQAVKYVVNSVPDAIKHFDLSEQRIEDMIRARLPGLMGEPEPNSGVVPHMLTGSAVLPEGSGRSG